MSSEKMKRMQSKKSHSWWWDSHISRKNSKWLAESLAEMDRSVKQMLKLIEEDADSFAKKAEMYYAKRPELVSHVEDFYRMYRALAERYDQVTGDLRKKIKSERKSQNLAAESDIASELSPPPAFESSEVTPISHSRHAMLTSRAAGFNFFLGADGNSDHSKNKDDSSSSSSSSSSDSDVDDLGEENVDSDSSLLHQRIFELENELNEMKEKLKIQEEKCRLEHGTHLENGNNHSDFQAKVLEFEEHLSDANIKLNNSEAQISDLRRKFEESTASLMAANVELALEKEKVYKFEEQIALLQDEISSQKQEIEQLKGAAEDANLELQSCLTRHSDQIEQCKSELNFAKEKYLQEKIIFENDSSMLHQRISELENELGVVTEKLKIQEDKGYLEHGNHLDIQAKLSELEEQLSGVSDKLKDSEAQVSELEKKLEESTAELSLEKEKVCKLEEEIALLQDGISGHKQEIEQLKGAAEAAALELQSYVKRHDDKIEESKNELNSANEKYLQEKSSLETRILELEGLNAVLREEVDKYIHDMSSIKAQISELEKVVHDLKASSSSSVEKLIQDKLALEADISLLSQSNACLEAEVKTLTEQIKQFETDRNEVNQNFEALKLNVDSLTTEKLELHAKLSFLLSDLKSRDDEICKMDQHLKQLHLEHVKMITDIEAARRLNSELQVRVKELEEEVVKQKNAVSESAEEKREVIRQLCFSLEHYRDGYNQLRQFLHGYKRSAIMAA